MRMYRGEKTLCLLHSSWWSRREVEVVLFNVWKGNQCNQIWNMRSKSVKCVIKLTVKYNWIIRDSVFFFLLLFHINWHSVECRPPPRPNNPLMKAHLKPLDPDFHLKLHQIAPDFSSRSMNYSLIRQSNVSQCNRKWKNKIKLEPPADSDPNLNLFGFVLKMWPKKNTRNFKVMFYNDFHPFKVICLSLSNILCYMFCIC